MTIPIPPDEALIRAAEAHIENIYSLRAVAHLAAKQAAEQAVKEAVLRIDHWKQAEYGHHEDQGCRAMLRRDFPSAFTPTPPKEQQPVTDDSDLDWADDEPNKKPSPDPATVRMCIEKIKGGRFLANTSAEFTFARSICEMLERDLLPKPTPAPEPERYVKFDPGASHSVHKPMTVAEIAARHSLLTPRAAHEAWERWHEGKGPDILMDALRLAAKQGGAA